MAKKNLLQFFSENILSKKETCALKGGRSYEPTNTGSYGFVNWDDVTIREHGFVVASNIKSTGTSAGSGQL